MNIEILSLKVTLVFVCFLATLIISYILISYFKTKTTGWEVSSIGTNSRDVIDTGPPFCSRQAVMKRYSERINDYVFPRALYLSVLSTVLLAYVFKLISPIIFGCIFFLLFAIFLLYFIDSNNSCRL